MFIMCKKIPYNFMMWNLKGTIFPLQVVSHFRLPTPGDSHFPGACLWGQCPVVWQKPDRMRRTPFWVQYESLRGCGVWPQHGAFSDTTAVRKPDPPQRLTKRRDDGGRERKRGMLEYRAKEVWPSPRWGTWAIGERSRDYIQKSEKHKFSHIFT